MKPPAIDSVVSAQPDYVFGEFRLQSDGTLLQRDVPVHIPAKELAALRLLLQHAGRIVTPRQLREALWGEVHVTPDSVPRCISSLRTRLGSEDCIQTVYKQGYRLTVVVRRESGDPASILPRLAIVPFGCGAGVPEHLGQAVAEDATARLTTARPPLFSLLARDSAFALAAKQMTAQAVGEALKADLVLTGTIQSFGTQFRLRMEMVRIKDGTQIWVEDVLVPREYSGALQEMLVSRLISRAGMPEAQLQGIEDLQPDPRAYELFLRGRFEWRGMERHRAQEGLRCLQQAADLDGKMAQARIELIRACVAQELFGYMAPRMAAEQVRHAAAAMAENERAYEAVLPALGWISFHVDRDLATAVKNFAVSGDAPFHAWHTRLRALFAASRHHFSEAGDLLHSVLELDPYSPWPNASLAWVYHLAGLKQESLRQVERCIELNPGDVATRLFGGSILAFHGQADRAVTLTAELAQQNANMDIGLAVHAYALARKGDRNAALEWLERLEWLGRERFVMRSFSAAAYLEVGNGEAAISELLAADRDRCPWFFQNLADPRLADLEGVADFQQMQRALEEMEASAAEANDEQHEFLGAGLK